MPAPSLRPSICVVAQGRGRAPNLSGQTLRDYQLLVNVSEREAPAHSEASCFLWLTGGRALKPQTLEECLWGLQAADWVTWLDTGTAPPPSLRHCAGPLGISRRMLERPESERSGRVRRLPWSCFTAGGAERPAAPAGPPPASAFRAPRTPAAKSIPLLLKERLNAFAGRPLFDLGPYLRSRPRAALVAGRVVDPLDYAVQPKGPRKRLGVFTPRLEAGGADAALRAVAGRVDRSRVEVVLACALRRPAEGRSRDAPPLPAWSGAADRVYDAAGLAPPELTARFLYSLALNWEFDALLLQGLPQAYALLPALKEKLPGLRAADVLHGGEDWDLFSASLDVDDCLDRRAAVSEAAKDRLWRMNVPEERITLVPDDGAPASTRRNCRALLEDLLRL